MKRVYTKPVIYIETFELMEHIAYCSTGQGITEVSYRDPGSCYYEEGGYSLFQNGVTGCDINESSFLEGGQFYGMADSLEAFMATVECYNAFGDGNFFAS